MEGIISFRIRCATPTLYLPTIDKLPADYLAGSRDGLSAFDSVGARIHCWTSQQWHPAPLTCPDAVGTSKLTTPKQRMM